MKWFKANLIEQILTLSLHHTNVLQFKYGCPYYIILKARFNGKCIECGEPIKTGREILKNSKGNWVHKACSDLEEELP